jgi:serine/threonine-protein kinase RsbW
VLLDVAVCLPQDAESVSLIRAVVRNALQSFRVMPECVDDICLALSEACTNVIDHAGEDEYEVRLEVDEWRCAISVKNMGHGFDAEALRDVMPDVASPRGRGVAIMHALMDRVEFSSAPQKGTVVRLDKQLDIEPDSLLHRLRQKAKPGD